MTTWGCRAGRRRSCRLGRCPRRHRPCACLRSPGTAAVRTVWRSAWRRLFLNEPFRGPGAVVLDLVERYSAVGGVFAREAQHALANHVAGHLRCAAAELRGLPRQVAFADEEQLGRPVDD